MPLPNPGSLWKFTRYAIRAAEYIIPATFAYLETLLTGNEEVEDLAWIRTTIVLSRSTPAGLSEDRVQFKLDVVNITGGVVDTTWTAGDFTDLDTAISAFVTSIKPAISSHFKFEEARSYLMRFNPDDPGPGNRSAGHGVFVETGPPVHVQTLAVQCTGTFGIPEQVATGCTMRTAFPRHWGRAYVPAPQLGGIDAYGRFTAPHRTAVADSFHDLVSTLADAELLAVVPMTQLGNATFHGLMGITDCVVDDVPDIQRRRRGRQVGARTIGA
jgi:hypothetical protein